MEDKFVTVFETLDTLEVNFFRAFLEDYGFEVQQESLQPIPGIMSPNILQVRESEAAKATKFLDELRQSQLDTEDIAESQSDFDVK